MIGERIQYLRQERGLTQTQLAKELQISKRALASYEQNVRKPNVDTVVTVAKYFNVSCDYLLLLTNKPTPLDEKKDKRDYIILPEHISIDSSAMKDFNAIKDYLLFRYNK